MKRILIYCFLLITQVAFAQNIPPKPNPPRLVNDFAGVLSASEIEALERKLVAYDDSTSIQIAVVTISTLNGASLEDYALKILRDWGVGNKKTNNGVVILAAINDRKVRIETGYGMEGAITDILGKTIIQNEIAPNFRATNYYTGLDKASDAIIEAAAGTYKAPRGYRDRGKQGDFPVIGFIIIILIILFILSRINRGGGGMMSRRGYRGLDNVPSVWWFPSGGGGSSGGGGWSGGGGGFGGFGGGGGGGGGASGDW